MKVNEKNLIIDILGHLDRLVKESAVFRDI